MVPGMGHCAGGDGPNTFNSMAALAEWVEQGRLRSRSWPHMRREAKWIAHGLSARIRRPRVYKGSGSTDDAANFSCKVPLP